MFEFLENERTTGHTVSNKMFQKEALHKAPQFGLSKFKAWDMFISRWKKRMNVTTRVATNESQKTPEELKEKVFLHSIKVCRIKNDLTPYNISNMDEMMVHFNCPPTRTNNIKGEMYKAQINRSFMYLKLPDTKCQHLSFSRSQAKEFLLKCMTPWNFHNVMATSIKNR